MNLNPRPGLAYVQSRITSPALTPETYRKWYEEVHIPDVLRACAPHITSAHRFLSPSPEKTTYPYLTLYPIRDTAWLRTADCSLFRVPLHHDLLPSADRFIFDVAAFDFRFYERIAGVGGGSNLKNKGVTRFVVVAQLDDMNAAGAEDGFEGRILEQSRASMLEGPGAATPFRSTLYKLDFVPPRPVKEGEEEAVVDTVPAPARYLVIHEFEEVSKEGVVREDALALEFSLLGVFGDPSGE
ncbi:hypothetical protein B0T22DRAFT_278861 [Podospora appendiculata]|uniref:EthD domain-containing protein n=1 Tax=Podospora appendiculata TaxID=314037 RepID=A0AAE0X0U8_9PEZI|nr:hypothetical protein B0T22DRAFT_278861 [Podospora appendiculata]